MQITSFQDPNTYAQLYANQNGISLEEAKSQLKAKYGDPSQENSSIFSNSDSDTFSSSAAATSISDILNNNNQDVTADEVIANLVDFFQGLIQNLFNGNNDEEETEEETENGTENKSTTDTNTTNTNSVAQNADDEVVNYANYWGVSYDEAREALRNMFGDPEGYEGADSNTNPFASSGSVAQNADDEVANYADHWGVSYDEAREALRNMFGDPEGYEGADQTNTTTTSGPSSVAQNSDDEVANYAAHWGVSYEEAREALRNMFGDPAGY